MSLERIESFQVAGTAQVDLRLPAGRGTFLPGEEGRVEVRVDGRDPDRFVADQLGNRIVLHPEETLMGRWGDYDVTVRVPSHTEVRARVASADLVVETSLADLRVNLASGSLRAPRLEGDLEVKSASGNVLVQEVAGRLQASTASGDVRVEGAEGPATVSTASGDVEIGVAGASLTMRTASGDVRVGAFAGDELECKTVSGDVRVGLVGGRSIEIDLHTLSGSIHNEFTMKAEGDGAARLSVRTVSGDILLVTAKGG